MWTTGRGHPVWGKGKSVVFSPSHTWDRGERNLGSAGTRGSLPRSRDRRRAAWPPHSLAHSDRQMIFVAGGTVLYNPKCSHLCNLQGLWSVPAMWYSHPLHLKDRQNVQEVSTTHSPPTEERGSCQAKGRRWRQVPVADSK